MTLRQRQPRVECPAFLAFVRRKPCCACGAPAPSQAAHIRMASLAMEKRSTGMSEKPSDRWAVPLCADCHLDGPDAQHHVGEQKFWYRVGIDPCSLAAKLYGQFERLRSRSPKQRERVMRRAKRVARRAKIDTSDIPETGEKFFKTAKLRWPSRPFPKGRKLRG